MSCSLISLRHRTSQLISLLKRSFIFRVGFSRVQESFPPDSLVTLFAVAETKQCVFLRIYSVIRMRAPTRLHMSFTHRYLPFFLSFSPQGAHRPCLCVLLSSCVFVSVRLLVRVCVCSSFSCQGTRVATIDFFLLFFRYLRTTG